MHLFFQDDFTKTQGRAKWKELGMKSVINIGRHLAREMGLDNPAAYGSRSFIIGEKSEDVDVSGTSEASAGDAEDSLVDADTPEQAKVAKEMTNFVLARKNFRAGFISQLRFRTDFMILTFDRISDRIHGQIPKMNSSELDC